MVVIRDPKKICFNFDWPKNFDENLKYEAEFIIKSNEFLAKNKTKKRLNNCCQNISMETILMNTENSKTNEPINLFLTCQ